MLAGCLGPFPSLSKRLLYSAVLQRRLGPQAGRAVLLTFDDGPHPDVTPAVLDRLREHGAQAVFFVVGRCIGRAPGLLKRIVEEGHFLGNHSHDHQRGGFLSMGRWQRDLARCQALIEEHAGIRPVLFRPPYGYLSPASLWAARSEGLRTITWSLDHDDWCCRTREAAVGVAAAILRDVSARDIILLHDDNPSVLTVLDHILPALVSRHFDLNRGAAELAGV